MLVHPKSKFIIADGFSHISEVKRLLWQYYEGITDYVRYDLYRKEMQELPGAYQAPAGHLLLLYDEAEQQYAGCVALRPHQATACEIKRLYVNPLFRGKGYGRLLMDAILKKAKEKGYHSVLLDSIPTMQAAIRLYQSLGFEATHAYYPNPPEGVLFMKLELI